MLASSILPSDLELTQTNPYIQEVLYDFWMASLSREASLIMRREVLTGKAKFGIMGGGKELPQIVLSKFFQKGDIRSGYYRDQTWMLALGVTSLEDMFAQLFADPDHDPFSHGRQMNSHFATSFANEDGSWTNHTDRYNVTSDISPTGGQMARAIGLALASKKYRSLGQSVDYQGLSNQGNEVCFCSIGDASTTEGVFWETINAAGVLQIPLAIFIWDDGYGISVPTKYQTTNGSISKILRGFKNKDENQGVNIHKVKGWDYVAMYKTFSEGIENVRRTHKPVVFHVTELVQPQGHSTSGSHERYKSKERLNWETKMDCLTQFKEWILDNKISNLAQLEGIEKKAKFEAREAKKRAWLRFREGNLKNYHFVKASIEAITLEAGKSDFASDLLLKLEAIVEPSHYELVSVSRRALYYYGDKPFSAIESLKNWLEKVYQKAKVDYHTKLYSDTEKSALKIPIVAPQYNEAAEDLPGYQILNAYFDQAFEKHPNLIAFGEDVGNIGDVNQGLAGLQKKYGEKRIFDTGIREWTIVGQAIGLAMRGFRPIAEIQYIDYLVYGLVPLTDDLATLRYRTFGKQVAPAIIRTRGHRLEGIWHSGSPMSLMLSSLRGLHICVPRNMVKAAGMYQTLLMSDDPAIVVEALNAYRLREKMPNNLGDYTVPLGVPEVVREGEDITLVTYGSCVRVAEEAAKILSQRNISIELIDVQTLLPFDLEHRIKQSLLKTNKLVILDEDVPGGASAYILQKIVEEQNAMNYLDATPITITGTEHRTPYGSEGDYFSKPNVDDVVARLYELIRTYNPESHPPLFAHG